MRVLETLAILLLLIASKCERGSETYPQDLVVVKGRLTDEGVECPTLRDRSNVLYSLAGSTGDYKRGDRVCVKGRIVEQSECMRGITITVEWIGLARWCP